LGGFLLNNASGFDSSDAFPYLSAGHERKRMPSSNTTYLEKKFPKEFPSLKDIFEFVGTFSAPNHLNDSLVFSIKFSIEEVFTNMVKYNPGASDVTISLAREGNAVKVVLVDVEQKPFDITKQEHINATLPIEKRKPGGLGIFLIKKIMDNVEYDHDGVNSRITLTKYLEHT
jgi:anti-sigma regulatory factor (Ser/Thr protein kinase)